MNKQVTVIREFGNRIFGQLVYFPYQWAFGISIQHLQCEGMGWLFRMYFGPIKIWFNLKPQKERE